MTRFQALALIVGFVGVLGWSAAAQAAPTSSSQDPSQLSTAAVLFVKVDPKTGTDTIVVVNRQQAGSSTTTGSAISIRVRFYSDVCDLKFDNNVSLTPQGFFAALASSLFGISSPGVVLADFQDTNPLIPTANSKFALSGVVIDGNFAALYERQGSPLLQPGPGGPVTTITEEDGLGPSENPVQRWGGFSDQSLDDWFIGGFTMIQMICPGPGVFVEDHEEDTPGLLIADMDALANFGSCCDRFTETIFASFFPVVNVYDAKEVLKRSIHDVPCFCNSDSAFFGPDSHGLSGYAGDFADILVSMKAVVLGTFHWDDPDGALIGWRVISSGGSAPVYWDARLRTTPGSALHKADDL